MRGVFSAIAVFLCLAGSVFGNVKKVVFLGPGQTRAFSYALDTRLRTSLESLSSDQPRLRRKLHAKFPLSPSLGEPSEAWFLLSKLAHRKRHEVRVCWPATQPTAFQLVLHDPSTVTESENLSESLDSYIHERGISFSKEPIASQSLTGSSSGDLLLQVVAKADYFTTNSSLSKDGLLVDIELILDPYIFNLLPQSLLPTAAYILFLAVVSWLLSGWGWKRLDRYARQGALQHGNIKEKAN